MAPGTDFHLVAALPVVLDVAVVFGRRGNWTLLIVVRVVEFCERRAGSRPTAARQEVDQARRQPPPGCCPQAVLPGPAQFRRPHRTVLRQGRLNCNVGSASSFLILQQTAKTLVSFFNFLNNQRSQSQKNSGKRTIQEGGIAPR